MSTTYYGYGEKYFCGDGGERRENDEVFVVIRIAGKLVASELITSCKTHAVESGANSFVRC